MSWADRPPVMPKRKIYQVSFFFDLHAVTSPGVWLCPKGKVSVRVTLFGVSEVTKLLPPAFPLLFHERFHFQKVFRKVGCLPLLESKLGTLPICLQLLQNPEGTTVKVKLAVFKGCLGDLLFPPAGGDVNLMFSPTKSYPGIIAPIAEVSTSISLQESEIEDGTMSSVPLTIFSMEQEEREKTKIVRQKPVCHTKQNFYCSCFKNKPLKKVVVPVNKRRQTGDWTKRIMMPAHLKSHKNCNGNFYSKPEKPVRSESTQEPSERTFEEEEQEQFKTDNEYNQRFYQEDFTSDKSYDKHLPRSSNYNQEDQYAYQPYPPGYSRNQQLKKSYNFGKEDYYNRRGGEYNEELRTQKPSVTTRGPDKCGPCFDPCKFYDEDCINQETKNNKDINELKRELKALLEEEEIQDTKPPNFNSCNEGYVKCCLCCPKTRRHNNLKCDGKNSKVNQYPCCRMVTQCCSDCTFAAYGRACQGNPNENHLEEDIRKRPLFYSSLYAAYQNLCYNRKHKKKPPWH